MSYDALLDRADLLFKIKLLNDRVSAFESGEKYVRMRDDFRRTHEAELRTIRRLETELEKAHKESVHIRELWFGVCLEIEKQKEKELAIKDKEIERLKTELSRAYGARQKEHEKYLSKLEELYKVKTELEDAKEKTEALEVKSRKDFTNSSKSSSLSPNHKTIHNSREKSGKSVGGQKGHVHNGRKKKKPTITIEIPAPSKYTDDDTFKPTGRIIRKQLINVRIVTEVIEYLTPEFRNKKTGQRVHAAFPPGIADDVTYGGTVKALAYLINNDLYTSIDKTRKFLSDVSHGAIDVSNGFICNLSERFSKLTQNEREEIFNKLAESEVLHADFTFGRVHGKQAAVIITTNGENVLYQGRCKKGDEGVKDSPLENYDGTVVSDHEAAIVKHGTAHQECLAHVERYAREEMENEPEKTWGSKLVDWIKETIGWRNDVCEGQAKYTKSKAYSYIHKLKKILETAEEEYEYEPPSRYFKKGYNLYKRMTEDFDDYVLFLKDLKVQPTNNEAERAGRKFKRKSSQVMAFRSDKGKDYFCDGLSITESIKLKNKNLYDEVTDRFNNQLQR